MDMAPAGTRPLLAVSRASGDVEIYDASQDWSVRRLPSGGAVGRAIENVLWLHPLHMAGSFVDLSTKGVWRRCEESHSWNRNGGHEFWGQPWQKTESFHLPRLMTAGLDGMLVEWDVETLRPVRVTTPGGGGLWSLTKSPDEQSLAVGCEDGAVRIIDAQTFAVTHTLHTNLEEGVKLLSMAWSKKDPNLVAVGTSHGHIVVFDIDARNIQSRMRLDEEKAGTEGALSIVWCVRFAEAMLVSGASTGLVQFWNPLLGTQISSCRNHQSDVLSIAVHSSNMVIHTSAADGRTFEFVPGSRYGGDFNTWWKPSFNISNHTHEVRASVSASIPCLRWTKTQECASEYHEMLITGGVDGRLVIWDYGASGKSPSKLRISSLPQHSLVRLAPQARLLVAYFNGSVRFWVLASYSRNTLKAFKAERTHANLSPEQLKPAVPGRLVLHMNIPNGESIQQYDISSDGKLFAYCTRSVVRLYLLDLKRKKNVENRLDSPVDDINVHKLLLPPDQISHYGQPSQLHFSPDSRSLAISYTREDQKGTILVCYAIDAASRRATVTNTLSFSSSKSAINSLSWAGDYIALHDFENQIHLIRVTDKLSLSRTLKPSSWVQSMRLIAVDAQRICLVAIGANKNLFIMNNVSHAAAVLEGFADLPGYWLNDPEPVVGIAHVPSESPLMPITKLRLWTNKTIVEYNLDRPLPTSRDSLQWRHIEKELRKSAPTMQADPELEALCKGNLQPHENYEGIMFLGWIDAWEAVVVERPNESLLIDLPKPQDRKRFGGF